MVPYCSTVYFPIVIEILVFESAIFNYYREVHSTAIMMPRRTTFLNEAAPEMCSDFVSTLRISFWFRPTTPAWSIFKESGVVLPPFSRRAELHSFFFPTPLQVWSWNNLQKRLLILRNHLGWVGGLQIGKHEDNVIIWLVFDYVGGWVPKSSI